MSSAIQQKYNRLVLAQSQLYFLLDDRANAHTSKKSLIFEMHWAVYEHTGKQRYSTYRQEEYDT